MRCKLRNKVNIVRFFFFFFFKWKRASVGHREQLWLKKASRQPQIQHQFKVVVFFKYWMLNVYFLCKSDIFGVLYMMDMFQVVRPVSTLNNQHPCVFFFSTVLFNFLFSWTFDHFVCFVYPCCFVLFVFCFLFLCAHRRSPRLFFCPIIHLYCRKCYLITNTHFPIKTFPSLVEFVPFTLRVETTVTYLNKQQIHQTGSNCAMIN